MKPEEPAAAPAPAAAHPGAEPGGAPYINVHNALRCKHCGTPAVTWSARLASQAQAYADTCPTGHATHEARAGTGENLYWAGGSPAAVAKSKDQWTKAVNSWYDEIQYYNFTTGRSKGGVTGHFTQVVWTVSTQVGCGFNDKCTNMFGGGLTNNAVVCRYHPAGNYIGEELAKVKPLLTSNAAGCAAHQTCTEAMRKVTKEAREAAQVSAASVHGSAPVEAPHAVLLSLPEYFKPEDATRWERAQRVLERIHPRHEAASHR